MSVIVRTHGGYGNQIFQVFYARLYAEQYSKELREIYDGAYYHGFLRSSELYQAPEPTKFECFISSLRVPKLLQKTRINFVRPFRFCGSVYLDSYFQTVTSYS